MLGKTFKEYLMKSLITVMALMMVMGCDGHYRYPCQDPKNWAAEECSNAVCQAEGECTANLISSPKSTETFNPYVDESFEEYTTQNDCTGD